MKMMFICAITLFVDDNYFLIVIVEAILIMKY